MQRVERTGVRGLWILDCLADLSMDLSRFHGVADVRDMDSASFMAACPRLLRYEGGSARQSMTERMVQDKAPARVATAAELAARSDMAARDAFPAIFEMQARKRAS